MKILVAGFNGNNNSLKILLENLPNNINKLYLENHKEESVNQILKIAAISDIILLFGQKPILKNRMSVERKVIEGVQLVSKQVTTFKKER